MGALVRPAIDLRANKATALCDQDRSEEIAGAIMEAVPMQDWLLRWDLPGLS
jgi:hypothetical protein